MKKLILGAALFGIVAFSCDKNKCAACHYDGPAGEVEMGTYCGDELHDIEASGSHTDSLGNAHVVHCGEH